MILVGRNENGVVVVQVGGHVEGVQDEQAQHLRDALDRLLYPQRGARIAALERELDTLRARLARRRDRG